MKASELRAKDATGLQTELESLLKARAAQGLRTRHVVLVMSAVSLIDTTGLYALIEINRSLQAQRIKLHLSEVKGPVMDRLKQSHFLQELTGKVHLSHFDAVASIRPELATGVLQSARAPGAAPQKPRPPGARDRLWRAPLPRRRFCARDERRRGHHRPRRAGPLVLRDPRRRPRDRRAALHAGRVRRVHRAGRKTAPSARRYRC